MPACDTSLVGLTPFLYLALRGKAGFLVHVLSVAFPAHVCTVRKGNLFLMRDCLTVHCNHIITTEGYTIGHKTYCSAIKALKIE